MRGFMNIPWPLSLKPRPGQLNATKIITEALENDYKIVLDAPTGWGKTLVTLIALKNAKALPTLWLVRSLSVGERIAEDAEKIGLRTFIAAGRNKTCFFREIEKGDVQYYCRFFRYLCPYLKALMEHDLPQTTKSYKDLVKYCKEKKLCPYYAQDSFIEKSDITIQNYFRRRFYAETLVIDEAHNLLMPRENKLSIDKLNDVIVAVERSPYSSKKSISSLISFKRFIENSEGIIDSRAFLDESVIVDLESALRFFLERKVKTRIGYFLRVLESDILYVEKGTIIGLKVTRFNIPRPSVLLSGTFIPELRRVLDIDTYVKIERKPLQAFVLTWLTSRYNEFEDNIADYKKLLNLLKRYGRVVAFGTQRVLSNLRSRADIYEENIDALPSEWSGILMLKTRGRFSEGVDINAEIVAILGAPYMTPDVVNRLSEAYRRLGFRDYKMLASDIPMLITTLQCVGRVTRNPDSKPVIILADYRYQYFEKSLSPFLEVTYVKDLYDLKKKIEKFFMK